MSQQQSIASPLEQAQICINTAMHEKSNLMAMLCILIQRAGNEVVITKGELENLDPDTELLQGEPGPIGFKLTTRVVRKQ